MRIIQIIPFIFCFSIIFNSSSQEEPEDIVATYSRDTVVWFGADFSFFKLSNPKKFGEDNKLQEYLFAWHEGYKSAISNVKLASLLKVKKVVNEKEFTDRVIKDFDYTKWIERHRHSISEEDVYDHLESYHSYSEGIGLVFIVENFFKGDPSKVYGYFVWFDLSNREPIQMIRYAGTPSTSYVFSNELPLPSKISKPKNKGMVGYWLQGMIDATLSFTIDYSLGKRYFLENESE